MPQTKRPFLAMLLAGVLFMLAVAPAAQADDMLVDEPSELAILSDALIARPLLIGLTGVGFALHTVALPFSVLGRNEDEMADIMVRRPARAAFLRCLGCTMAQDQSRRISRQVDDGNAD